MILTKIKRLSEQAKVPKKADPGAAGYDLFWSGTAVDPETGEEIVCEDHIMLHRGKRLLFKLGFAMEFPDSCYFRIAPRSGTAFKNGFDVLAGVIDSSYRGEVGVLLVNHGRSAVQIHVGDRIAQGIFELHGHAAFAWTDKLSDTSRGEGGYGSTGQR